MVQFTFMVPQGAGQVVAVGTHPRLEGVSVASESDTDLPATGCLSIDEDDLALVLVTSPTDDVDDLSRNLADALDVFYAVGAGPTARGAGFDGLGLPLDGLAR